MKQLHQAAATVVLFALAIQAAAILLRPLLPSVLALLTILILWKLLWGRRL